MSVMTVWLVQREASLCSDNVIQGKNGVCNDCGTEADQCL